MRTLVLAARHLRSDRIPVLGFVVLVTVTALVAALAPRVTERAATEALRDVVRDTPAIIRDPQLHRAEVLYQFPDIASVARAGESLGAGLPAGVRAAVGDATWVIESGRFRVAAPTPDPSFMYLRIQERALDGIRIVDGRLPTGATRTVEVDDGAGGTISIQVLEVVLASDSLTALAMHVGDVVPLLPDGTDNVSQWRGSSEMRAEIVGAFEVIDPALPYWTADPGPIGPVIRSLGGDSKLIDTVALLAPEAYPTLGAAASDVGPPLQRYRWRFQIDPDRLTWSGVDAFAAGLRQLETQFPSVQGTRIDPARVALQTGLLRVVARHVAAWRPAEAIFTMVATGTAVVALGALALLAVLVTSRRRNELATWRARGASAPQLLRSVVVEAVVLVLPFAALTTVAAATLVPLATGSPSLTPADVSIFLAGAVALVAILLLVIAAASAALALPGSVAAERARTAGAGRTTPRRLVLEGVVVVLALAGAWLLRSRGLGAASSAGGGAAGSASGGGASAAGTAGPDPFLAAVPALVGLAVALLALRLTPPILALVARVAAAARGLVPVLAMRRAARAGSGAIFIVLLATAVLGTFGSAVLMGLTSAATAIADQEVGAPYRLDAPLGRFPPGFDPDGLPGVEAAAAAGRTSVTVGLRGARLDFLALDVAGYAAVEPDVVLPAELLGDGADGPIPAVISSGLLAENGELLTVGDTTAVRLGGYDPVVRVVAIVDRFGSLPADGPFMIVARQHLSRIIPDGVVPVSAWYLRALASAGAELAAAAVREAPGAALLDRAARVAGLAGAPIPIAVRTGLLAATLAAGLYAALAVAAAITLVAAARTAEVAHLRVMGLGRRGAVTLVALEHAPTVLVASALGVGTGIGLFELLRDGLRLEGLLGSTFPVTFSLDPVRFLPVVALVAGVVVVGVVLGALLQGRAAPAAAIRRGIE